MISFYKKYLQLFALLQNIDEKGNLINAECGAATLKYFYNSQGRFSRWEVYDKEGNPSIGPSNTSGEQNVFKGNDLTDIIFFDRKGNPAIHWSGAEWWHFEYDEYGNKTSLTYQKNDGRPMRGNQGVSQNKFKWSKGGRFLLSQSFYGMNEEPQLLEKLGVHQVEFKRNNKGQIIEKQFKNVGGHLVNRKDNGVARIRYSYDEKGFQIKAIPYNIEGAKITL